MLGLPIIGRISVVVALAAIGLIGFDMLTRKEPQRREGDGGDRQRTALPEGVDPASLRKRRPMTNKLMGGVLLASVAAQLIVLVPAF